MIKYRCANNPDHVYEKPTDDFWCNQCDISTKPMLEPFEDEQVVVKSENQTTNKAEQTIIAPILEKTVVVEEKKEEPLKKVITEKERVIKKPDPVFVHEQIKFGNQIWMKRYLSLTEFSNGEKIVHAKDEKEWKRAKRERIPAWCYSGYDAGITEKHGLLYNFYAVSHPAGLAPKGWRIPNLKDVESLSEEYSIAFIDSHLKLFQERDVNHRLAMGSFIAANNKRVFWTSEKKIVYTAFSFEVQNVKGGISIKQFDKSAGFFVRCIKKD
jgi:hypothetical protein